MKAYLITTGTIFGLMTLIHLWRIVDEWRTPDRGFLISMVVITSQLRQHWRRGRFDSLDSKCGRNLLSNFLHLSASNCSYPGMMIATCSFTEALTWRTL